MEHIKVSSVSEAWRAAARIFPTDYEKNEENSKRAGYPIYETTSTDERFSGFHISDLNTRLLKPIEDRGITVMQGWYDKDLNKCHVTLWDLGETDDNFSDDDAEGVTLSLQVTIFSKEDEVELAREIKSLMKENGFSFEGRNGDDSKPEDGIYMKAQRFTKYYESEEKS